MSLITHLPQLIETSMATFLRGAKPSPHHKLMAAPRHRVVAAPPPEFSPLRGKVELSVWDNDTDGVCVSSEEAFAKAAWSVYCGLPEVFATSAEVRTFAARHGWLNGATLTEVMDVMIAEGMSIGGAAYKDGKYSSVDYSDEAALQSAIAAGPVKIAIDADALPGGAGNGSGWYATQGGRYRNTDHCVGLPLYGTAQFVYKSLADAGLISSPAVPPGLDPNQKGYGLFTWGTIGFVTHEWLMGTCTEAWVRNPTTVGQTPAPPVPPGPPAPVGYTAAQSAPVTGTVHIPPFGHFAVTGTAAVASVPVTKDKAEVPVGAIWSIFADLIRLHRDIAPYGPGMIAAFDAVVAAIRARTGILSAIEDLARQLIAAGSDSKVLADLLAIALDLGIPVPADSVLRPNRVV